MPRQPVAVHRFHWCLPKHRKPSTSQLNGQACMYQHVDSYQLIAADHGHDAEGFDAILLGIEGWTGAIVSKHDVGVDLGVQVGDADVVVDDSVFETRLRLGIAAAAASPVFTSAALLAIAIDIHVNKLLPVAV